MSIWNEDGDDGDDGDDGGDVEVDDGNNYHEDENKNDD